MSVPTRVTLCLLLVAVAACQPGKDKGASPPSADAAGAPPPTAWQPPASERTWAGLLPCRDCQGIDTRLVLRFDGGRRAYLMTETYLGGSGKTSFNRAGTWTEVQATVDGEPQVTYVLDPDQAAQRFVLQPDGALELLDADRRAPEQAVAYRLQRL